MDKKPKKVSDKKNTINKNRLTHIAVLLDKSASMCAVRDDAIKWYNEQITQIQEDAKEQNIKVSLILFNGNVFESYWAEDPSVLKEATREDYQPSGCTAMLDAMGYTMSRYDQEASKEDDDTAYLMVVITDGEENSSVEFNHNNIRKMVESHQEEGNWTITFMGCDKNILDAAHDLGVAKGNTALYENSKRGYARASSATNDSITQYLRSRKTDKTFKSSLCTMSGVVGDTADFTPDDKQPIDNSQPVTPKPIDNSGPGDVFSPGRVNIQKSSFADVQTNDLIDHEKSNLKRVDPAAYRKEQKE